MKIYAIELFMLLVCGLWLKSGDFLGLNCFGCFSYVILIGKNLLYGFCKVLFFEWNFFLGLFTLV